MSEELSGNVLVRSCAEKVIGWPIFDIRPFTNAPSYPYLYDKGAGLYIVRNKSFTPVRWNPLASMDNCFEMVDAMAAQGWDLSLSRYNAMWIAGFEKCAIQREEVEDTKGEAICRAALKALECANQ